MDNVYTYCNVNNSSIVSTDRKYTVSRGWKESKTAGLVLRNAETSTGRSDELCWRVHTIHYKRTIVMEWSYPLDFNGKNQFTEPFHRAVLS